MRIFLTCIAALFALTGCITPTVTRTPTSAGVSFQNVKLAIYSVHDLPTTEYGSDRKFSADEISLFRQLLGDKLESMGYEKPAADATADMTIDIAVTESKEGSGAARFWVGMGAGRAVMTFDAVFKNSGGIEFASFQGGRSYTGMEIGKAFASADDIRISAATRAVSQVEEFIKNNGTFPSQNHK